MLDRSFWWSKRFSLSKSW